MREEGPGWVPSLEAVLGCPAQLSRGSQLGREGRSLPLASVSGVPTSAQSPVQPRAFRPVP